jgi:hypothetical protein
VWICAICGGYFLVFNHKITQIFTDYFFDISLCESVLSVVDISSFLTTRLHRFSQIIFLIFLCVNLCYLWWIFPLSLTTRLSQIFTDYFLIFLCVNLCYLWWIFPRSLTTRLSQIFTDYFFDISLCESVLSVVNISSFLTTRLHGFSQIIFFCGHLCYLWWILFFYRQFLRREAQKFEKKKHFRINPYWSRIWSICP